MNDQVEVDEKNPNKRQKVSSVNNNPVVEKNIDCTTNNNKQPGGSNKKIFYLNIGGTPFDVSSQSLRRIPFFEQLWRDNSDRTSSTDLKLCTDRNGRVFVDRDGIPFADIMTYLRTNNGNSNKDYFLSQLSLERLGRLADEADYYCMTELAQHIRRGYLNPGVSFCGENWIQCAKPTKASNWKVVGGGSDKEESSLIDFDCPNLCPGSFEVKETNKFLVLFHHDWIMPHMDNLKYPYDPLVHLYTIDTRAGVDEGNDQRNFVRFANIDIRTKKKLQQDGPVFCTHSGVDIVEFQKGDRISVAVSVPGSYYRNDTPNVKTWKKDRGQWATNDLFYQLSLIPIELGPSPCRARLNRIITKSASTTAKWSEVANDGLVSLSNDGTKISLRQPGVYFICSQVAARYAAPTTNGTDLFGILEERVWLEQNNISNLKFRKNLLAFPSGLSDRLEEFAPYRKDNFQLGRMADVLVCQEGDELSIHSERNVLFHTNKINFDNFFNPRDRTNPEFLDIMRLQDDDVVQKIRRFRSTDENEEEQNFKWTCIDDDDDDDDDDEEDEAAWVQPDPDEDNRTFIFTTPGGEREEDTTMQVLVLATIQCLGIEQGGERVCLEMDDEPQIISYIERDQGHFHHINTVVEAKMESKMRFCHVSISDASGEWTASIFDNDFLTRSRHGASVTFIRIK